MTLFTSLVTQAILTGILLAPNPSYAQHRYEDQGGCAKQQILWQHTVNERYQRLPPISGAWSRHRSGQLTLQSQLIASKFGDQQLFFRHQQR